jgi:hypothetical protein
MPSRPGCPTPSANSTIRSTLLGWISSFRWTSGCVRRWLGARRRPRGPTGLQDLDGAAFVTAVPLVDHGVSHRYASPAQCASRSNRRFWHTTQLPASPLPPVIAIKDDHRKPTHQRSLTATAALHQPHLLNCENDFTRSPGVGGGLNSEIAVDLCIHRFRRLLQPQGLRMRLGRK